MILIGIILTHLFLLLNLKFTAWPEMLLWPYLLIQGILPYKDVAIVHTPHLILNLAFIYKIFGVGIKQLEIYTWILIISTDLIVYWIAKKLWNINVALVTVSTFAIWQLFFDGNGLWFDLMLAPLALITFFLTEKKRYFWVGIFWAVMFLTKQTAVWFLIPVALSTFSKNKKINVKNIVSCGSGVLIIFGLFTITLASFHLLTSFYEWAIHFGIFILPKAQGQIQLPDLKNLIVALFPFTIFIPLFWKTKTKNTNLFFWAIAGGLGAYPRFEYFHFQPAIPFLAIASGLVFQDFKKEKQLIKVFVYFYIFGSLYLFASFFMKNYREGVRFYETNVSDIASYVRANTKSGDKIFVMNWWDNIYPLTNTIPATDPWVPQLSWYQEIPGIQEKEVEDIKNSKPKLILLQDYTDSGLASYKPQKVFDYVNTNYKLKEKVDDIEILVPNK